MTQHQTSTGTALRLITGDVEVPAPGRARQTVVHGIGGPGDEIRAASVIAALDVDGYFRQVLVHAGDPGGPAPRAAGRQGAPARLPDHRLGVSQTGYGERMTALLGRYEKVLVDEVPDVVVVYGDGNPALACALAAAKLGIAVAHVGAGVRAQGRATPRDRNRILIDRLADTLLAPDQAAASHLFAEGIPDTRVHVVGPTHLDVLADCDEEALARRACRDHGLLEGGYVLVLLREAADVAGPRGAAVAAAVQHLAEATPVVLCPPAWSAAAVRGAHVVQGPGYVEHLSLIADAGAVVTDSPVTLDEATALGVVAHDVGATDDPRWIPLVRPAPRGPLAIGLPAGGPPAGAVAARILDTHYALRVAPALPGGFAQ